MLWPQLDESSGRRNLRRELARLREAGVEGAVRAEGDLLALSTEVASDIGAFDAALAGGRPDDALAHWRGPPADGLALDDAEAFDDWLALERERLLALRRRALEASATAHESQGNHEVALQRVESLLADDPLQEQHHRDAIRLHMACGRREAALSQFERCRQLLDSELGLQPMADTEDLAAFLRGHAAVAPASRRAPAAAASRSSAPAALLPELLPFVGRRSELAWLEAAWPAGHALLIEGEAGAGKSRLAADFAATQGPYALARCRSGDAGVPYASFTRALRVLAGPALDLGDAKPWVRNELTRLLPELGTAPPPLRGEAERSRFIEACTLAWLALGADNFDAVILDDWHQADAASRELLAYVAQRRQEQGGHGARELLLYRPDLDSDAAQAVQRLREDAGARHLRLGPLAADAVLELLQHLSGAERPERFATRLGQATAGNPFFLAETLRHLAEQQLLSVGSDGLWSTPFDDATQDYRELPVPESVHAAVLAERCGFTLMLRGILFKLVCAHVDQTHPALALATAQRGWGLRPPLPLVELRIMYRLAFVDAHVALGGLGQAREHAVAAVDEAIALGTQLALAATAKTCIELLALVGDDACSGRLLAAIDDNAMRQLPQVANEMWVARAQAALLRGDLAAAPRALAQAASSDTIESPRERARLALASAELAWAEGDARRALALLPNADAPGMNDELRLGVLAIRIRVETGRGELTATTGAAARAGLNAEVVHAIAALGLHRALIAAQQAGAAGMPDDALRDGLAHVQRLADSLRDHPDRQAAFLKSCG